MQELTRVTAPTIDVLTVLSGHPGPIWGLHIIKETSRAPGTVYPILSRLEGLGWVRSFWDSDADRAGPRRRLYEFTAEGSLAAAAVIAKAAEAPSGRRTTLNPGLT